MIDHSAARRYSPWVLFATATVLLVGCGPTGPARYDLSGTVTYQGQPVPAGEVYFRPDTAQGNSGPASYAMIHEGRYETLAGQGIVGGPHVVEIIGFSAPPAGEGAEGGEQLFDKVRLEMDLANEDAEVDLVVPSQ